MAITLGRAMRALRISDSQRCIASGSKTQLRSMSALDTSTSSASASAMYEPALDSTRAEVRSDEMTRDNACHLMKMQYLHPSTKPPAAAPRRGDLQTGRVRPDPVYIPLSKHVFGLTPIRKDVVHAAVLYYLHGRRKGLAHTKTRGEIAFSGAKIRPQKGTGQARLGRRNNPLLRKGGVIHGPKPRDMSTKLNRRVRELALRSALSAKLSQGQLQIVKNLEWIPPPSTGLLRKLLQSKKWNHSVILTAPRHPQSSLPSTNKPNPKPSATDPVYTEAQEEEHRDQVKNFITASNNAANVEVINLANLAKSAVDRFGRPLDPNLPSELHAYYIIKKEQVILDLGAVEWLEEKLGGAIFHDVDVAEYKQEMQEARAENGAPIADLKDHRIIGEAERVVATI